ncbi:zinc-ribbon domain-containing protein [[Eubacterium] cellulosolvens]
MVFCSNCGSELKGAMKFCKNCGYKIEGEEYKIIKNSTSTEKDSNAGATKSVVTTPKHEDYAKDKIRIPPGAKVKSKIPKSTTCVTCNIKTDDICYFCNYAVCKQHSVKMQIYADNSKFGNAVESCAKCAERRNGKQPTKDEAEDIGFFFKIKPYHEWKIIE